jgi:hypothetical protein
MRGFQMSNADLTRYHTGDTQARSSGPVPSQFGNVTMCPKSILVVAIMSLLFCSVARGQEHFADARPRLLLDTEIGSESSLGYDFPSISFGPSLEIPVKKRFEFQVSGAYSPDKKNITHNGELASVSGSALGFVNRRIGFIAKVERGWLWTSQFDKAALFPSAGIVIRNDYFGHGRLFMTYTFPTGCVWATPNVPCKTQSNRLQGITLHQDFRSRSNTRWGLETGFYNFCNEANPNEPNTGRNCHWGATARAIVAFEFHLGKQSRFAAAEATNSDNY